jgi:hypothetical protein
VVVRVLSSPPPLRLRIEPSQPGHYDDDDDYRSEYNYPSRKEMLDVK